MKVAKVSNALRCDWRVLGLQPALVADFLQVGAVILAPVNLAQYSVKQGRNCTWTWTYMGSMPYGRIRSIGSEAIANFAAFTLSP